MSRTSRAITRSLRGFTLVELMVVVVIIGVLSAVAVMSYSLYVRRARISEAAGLLANIKANQESYRSEFGLYCDVDSAAPADPPNSQGNEWATGDVATEWTQLGFAPDNRIVRFQLDTIADTPGNATLRGWTGGDNRVDLPVEEADDFTRDHWFIARALGNSDNDDDLSVFWITHMTTAVAYRREVE